MEKNIKATGGGLNRESNFELLRILCIVGILVMHTAGSVYDKVTGINLVYGTLINSICNIGVTMFVLISGYFGIKTNIKKIVSIELITIFYSILSLIEKYLNGITISMKDIIHSCFPISSGLYWYITAYMLIMLFADYINLIPEKLNKKNYQRLIFIMLCVFCIFPSIIQIHIMNDSGKGVLNMLLIYLIGRYIHRYKVKVQNKSRTITAVILLLIIEFNLNYFLAILRGGVGIYAPFARDYSVFIVALSILLFLLIKEFKITSSFVNTLAQNIIGIYLFEGTIRRIIYNQFDINKYVNTWYLFGIIILISVINFIVCSLIEIFRRKTIGHIEMPIAKFIITIIKKVTEKI